MASLDYTLTFHSLSLSLFKSNSLALSLPHSRSQAETGSYRCQADNHHCAPERGDPPSGRRHGPPGHQHLQRGGAGQQPGGLRGRLRRGIGKVSRQQPRMWRMAGAEIHLLSVSSSCRFFLTFSVFRSNSSVFRLQHSVLAFSRSLASLQ